MINDVFDPDLADVKPAAVQGIKDAAAKAKASEDGCYPPPAASFTAQVKSSGDGSFDASLGQARADALQQTLTSLGYGEGRVKTGHATGSSDSVQVNYDAPNKGKDTDPPRLKVTWTPPKNTKVKAGDKIRVTIIANERYADGHKSQPTGVQSIQFIANEEVVDSKDYGKPPQPCARQTLDATYTVPNDPKPIIHLHAIAEDGVGNHDGEDADVPTGKTWKGTLRADAVYSVPVNGPAGAWRTCRDAWAAETTVVLGSKGKLEGYATARRVSPLKCEYPVSVSLAEVIHFKIEGTHDAAALHLHFAHKSSEPSGGVDWTGFSAVLMGMENPKIIDLPIVGKKEARSPVALDWVSGVNKRNISGDISLICADCE